MQRSIFAVLVICLSVAFAVTSLGLLANWGIWIESSVVQAGQPLPLLKGLTSGVVLGAVGLALEISRRIFLARPDSIQRAYLELLGLAVVEPASSRAEADATHTALADFFEQYSDEAVADTRKRLLEQVSQAVGKAAQTKFGGSARAREVPEVRLPD